MFNNEATNQRLLKNSLYNSINETPNGIPRNFTSPKITSTPFHPIHRRRETLFATPPKPHLLSPKKYALSDIATPPRRGLRETSRPQSPTGPLLASTRYNVNVSTYMDTKSPGLTSRIVQYEEEQKNQQRSMPTHQKKYNSPGLFPIVHLFKKKPPVLEQKPKTVTVRIASPEYSRHNSQEYNRMLMEGIVKPSSSTSGFSPPKTNSTSTRSVLDALKEISRKRIHANEDFDLLEESGKRQKTDYFNGMDNNKRYRDDTSVIDSPVSPSSTQKSKRVCVYDEYAASISSSMSMLPMNKLHVTPKRKSITTSTSPESPIKETKQVKLINAETQTLTTQEPEKLINEELQNTEIVTTNAEAKTTEREMPVKIFDDAPLDRIRKNRLAALMGTLAGKSPVLMPKPSAKEQFTMGQMADETDNKSEKPLVGILSTPKRSSPVKSDKHVTFNLSANIAFSESSSSSTGFDLNGGSSKSITTNANTSTLAKTNINEPSKLILSKETTVTPTPPTSPVMFEKKTNDVTSSASSTSLSQTLPISSTTTMNSGLKPLETSNSLAKSAALNFENNSRSESTTNMSIASSTSTTSYMSMASSASTTSLKFETPSTLSTSPKPGGFKFDLSPSKSNAPLVSSTSSTLQFSFGTSKPSDNYKPPSATVESSTNKGGFSFGKSTASATPSFGLSTSASPGSTPSFNFGSATQNSTPTTSTPSFNFKSNTSASSTLATTIPSFGNNSNAEAKLSEPSSFNFKSPSSTPPSVSKPPAFGVSSSTAPTFGGGMPSSSTASAFGGGSNPAPTFEVKATSVPSPFGLNTTTTTPSMFGMNTPSTAPSFGGNSTTPSAFGASNTSVSSFGLSTATSTTPSFGLNTSKAPSFGVSKPLPAFGSTTTTTSSSTFGGSSAEFGATSAPSFGVSTPSFGTPTTKTASSGFGGNNFVSKAFNFNSTTPTPTPGPMFGQKSNAFGDANNSSPFSANAAPNTSVTTSAAVFGKSNNNPISTTATSVSMFGKPTTAFGDQNNSSPFNASATSSPFNATTANTSAPLFGNTNTNPTFGAATTTAPIFGTTNTPSFGQASSNIFGAPNVTAPPSKPLFGGTSGTSGFNSTPSANAFGSPNTFAAKTTASSFGGSTFGVTTTANSTFGTATTTFGNSSGSTFGNGSTSGFGGNTNTTGGFGTTTNGFAASGNATSGTTGFGGSTSTFGAVTTTASPSTFGSPAVNSNMFEGASNNNFNSGGFGTNNTASAFSKPASTAFGANNSTPSFGAQTGSTFGVPAPATTQASGGGVFNFGASAAAPKPAASGVFSFGGGANLAEVPKPSFNFTGGSAAANSPSFGAPTPNFGAPAVATFNAPPQAGSFSIGTWNTGTGTSQRAKSKAKRRT
ncbi:unnamed protein product [Brassicogethes aeneus]|uniref:Uncharacterized protein n=1 Tax=Brassicogethes aeneus TaxID=1431903 RepID=A0A9P0B7M4_BRAAE|nr:unnamed protein product [Brassicogethes aeneus]